MHFQILTPAKSLAAEWALERSGFGVRAQVQIQIMNIKETFPTFIAHKLFHPSMEQLMIFEMCTTPEHFPTLFTC
jgi:hypothetical protein